MQWPTTVARRGAVPLLIRRKMNGCSLFGCSARSNRLCENGCPEFSLLLLLGADEQIFGVNEQILESVRKHQAGLQSFRSMRRIEASRRNASALRLRFSQSLASLRQRLSQAKVRSTTQRRGSTTNPLVRSERLTISVSS